MTASVTTCPQCAATVGQSDRFCGSCGTTLSEIRLVAVPRPGRAAQGPCVDCGNATFTDDYCSACGHRRTEPDRDEAELAGVVVVTDRGLHHARNEDAAAVGVVAGGAERPGLIAIVVCDGVSSSDNPEAAAVAASKTGVDTMLAALTSGRPAHAAVLAGLADAAKAAATAGVGVDPASAPSCTYTAAVVIVNSSAAVEITIGNVGDSRAYWLPDPPGSAQQLTVDDSLAQELMTAGFSADSEAVLKGAHTITRWLGADAGPKPWSDSAVRTITAAGRGSLLLCSDGLWNYLPGADDIRRFCTGTDAGAAARALVAHALQSGGEDNITVAVIPIGGAQ
jgi:serine/threonine protein phosphatase PrpC